MRFGNLLIERSLLVFAASVQRHAIWRPLAALCAVSVEHWPLALALVRHPGRSLAEYRAALGYPGLALRTTLAALVRAQVLKLDSAGLFWPTPLGLKVCRRADHYLALLTDLFPAGRGLAAQAECLECVEELWPVASGRGGGLSFGPPPLPAWANAGLRVLAAALALEAQRFAGERTIWRALDLGLAQGLLLKHVAAGGEGLEYLVRPWLRPQPELRATLWAEDLIELDAHGRLQLTGPGRALYEQYAELSAMAWEPIVAMLGTVKQLRLAALLHQITLSLGLPREAGPEGVVLDQAKKAPIAAR